MRHTSIFCLVSTISIVAALACREDEVFFDESCYFISDYYNANERRNFEDVGDACAERRAYPVVISNEEEHAFLAASLHQYNNVNYREQYWTSATDTISEGTWRWTSGHVWSFPPLYTPWEEHSKEPNDGEMSNCGAFSEYGIDSNQFNLINAACDELMGYICEKGNWPVCDEPRIMDYGVVLFPTTYPANLGTILQFGCQPGYTLAGDSYLECIEAPGWTGNMWTITLPLPQCIPTDGSCQDPGPLPLNIIWVNNILPFPVKNGVTLNYRCETGSLVGSPALVCIDGTWNLNIPFCKDSANLAYNKSTLQFGTDWGGPSLKAVDGNADSRWASGSCTCTAITSNPWWQVNLGDVYDDVSVVIYGRDDPWADRLNGATVKISPYANGPFSTCGTVRSAENVVITINCVDMFGQYITIQKISGYAIITLCEVQVFGTASSEPLPRQPTTYPLNSRPSVSSTAGCDPRFYESGVYSPDQTNPSSSFSYHGWIRFACDDGFTMVGLSSIVCNAWYWMGRPFPICDKNYPNSVIRSVSLGLAGQSSRVLGSMPDRVSDGKTSGLWNAGTCTQTKVEDNPWLKIEVDLKPEEYIYYLVVTVPAMNGGIVRTAERNSYAPETGTICGDPIVATRISVVMVTCDPPVKAQYISIHVPGTNQELSICEVEVFAKVPHVLTSVGSSTASTFDVTIRSDLADTDQPKVTTHTDLADTDQPKVATVSSDDPITLTTPGLKYFTGGGKIQESTGTNLHIETLLAVGGVVLLVIILAVVVPFLVHAWRKRQERTNTTLNYEPVHYYLYVVPDHPKPYYISST